MTEKYQTQPKPLLPFLIGCFLVALYCTWLTYRAPFECLIAHGGPGPQYRLGLCYYEGLTVSQSYTQAFKWFSLAANQGHAAAQEALGMMYFRGVGVARNYQAALKLLRKAAGQGLDTAENQLGMMYAQGKGVPQDLDVATEWFAKAENHGCRAARYNQKFLAATRPTYLPSLTLRNGTTYHTVNVRKVEFDGVTISYQPCRGGFGITKLQFRDLPDDFRKKCGQPESAPARLASSAQLAVVVVGTM
jgi:TPR repeat protein